MSESVKILVVVGGAFILCYQDHNPGWFVVALLIFILDEVSAIRAAVAPKLDPRSFGPQNYDESDLCVKCEKEFKPGLKKMPLLRGRADSRGKNGASAALLREEC